MYKKTKLKSFDNTISAEVNIGRPEKYAQLFDLIKQSNRIISRGSGLNYSAASFGERIVSIDTSHFNRILAFDKQTGQITVEPGLKIGELLAFAIAHGWYPPVLPGHPSISVGGCIAANVHGKSQYHNGNFIGSVISLKVFHPDYGEVVCAAKGENSSLFFLTVGGFGFTGHITEVVLQLVPKKGDAIVIHRIPVKNIFDAIGVLRESADRYEYVYSWNNLMRKGERFGKGFVLAENFSSEKRIPSKLDNLLKAEKQKLPFSAFNTFSMPIINWIYELKEKTIGENQILDIHSATFPIYGKEFYFSLMGKKGFLEYQLIIPFSEVESFMEGLAKVITEIPATISLGSLKIFKGTPKYLQFSMEGICLAIDVPYSKNGLSLFNAIDRLAIAHHCSVNLSKDSRLTAKLVDAIFTEYKLFKSELKQYDPNKLFSSALRERLEL